MNTEQDFEELAKRWPDLMAKSQQEYLGVGRGWLPIIDTLCGLISSDIESAKRKVQYAKEHPDAKFSQGKTLVDLEADVEKAREELPCILQIKEKFGSLRFYVSGASDDVRNYITFAECMASRTCEVCGSPGKSRQGGWIKTLCDTHHRERQEGQDIFNDEEEFD